MPEIRDFVLIITGWGESGKVTSQVSIAVYSGSVEKFFGQKWLSPPRKNWPIRLWAQILDPPLHVQTTNNDAYYQLVSNDRTQKWFMKLEKEPMTSFAKQKKRPDIVMSCHDIIIIVTVFSGWRSAFSLLLLQKSSKRFRLLPLFLICKSTHST